MSYLPGAELAIHPRLRVVSGRVGRVSDAALTHPHRYTSAQVGGGLHGLPGLFAPFPLLPGQPDRLLSELYQAQTALAIVEYHFSCWRAYPFTGNAPPFRHHSYAAHEALHETREIIDRVIEELRIQVAGTPFDAEEKPSDEPP